MSLLHGIPNEIVDDIADVLKLARTGDAVVEVVTVGDIALGQLDTRQLILLGHVIQQMPTQIAAVIIGSCRRCETEKGRFDPGHGRGRRRRDMTTTLSADAF